MRKVLGVVLGVLSWPIMVHAGATNLIYNGGFELPVNGVGELPSGWVSYATRKAGMAIVAGSAKSGAQCLQMNAQQAKNAGQGVYEIVKVTGGGKYDFSACVRSDREAPLKGSAFGQLVIEWLNERGREIARSASAAWGNSLPRGSWRKYELLEALAPEGAVEGKFGIHLYEGPDGGIGGVLIDEITLEER